MREILFRGKRLDIGEWVKGTMYQIGIDLNPFIMLINKHGASYEVDPSTVGQFTERCDKNKVRIFEGDILHFWSDYREAYTGKCVVKYGDFNCNCCEGVYGWYLENGDIRYLSNEENPVYEVCGKIHDNPELLGGKNNG